MTISIPSESLTVELKSDRRRLSDRQLVEAAVCLANTEGGSLYVGIEDDGKVTGLHPSHDGPLDGLAAMVANRTAPPLAVHVSRLEIAGKTVAHIEVPKARQITATSEGVVKRRRLLADGKPECVPFLPHEFPSRLSDLRIADLSRQPVEGASLEDLDPVERARLRQFVERFHGDRALLELSDDELDGALGAIQRGAAGRQPTLLGMLLFGKESSLRRLVPTHEVAFQVLDGDKVRFNEFSRSPLLQVFEWVDTLFAPLNAEDEILVGPFRVPIPRLERTAFREALANALTHRDYSRLGAIHVRLERDALVISNPGGFVEGVTLDNLLTTEPLPRNPALADAFKRSGLVERTGRGVELIYRGLLRFGRPVPDYGRSSAHGVVLRFPLADADIGFLQMILYEEERLGGPLPIDSMIALATLRQQRRLSRAELADLIQKDDATASRTLEALRESGLVQSHGRTKGATYTLSPQVYASLGQRAEYARQAGFSRLQQEQMVRRFVAEHGSVTRSDVMDLCQLGGQQATRLLKRLTAEGVLQGTGQRRWRKYLPGPNLEDTAG
jgi:ATP-dependent DNA helicase RecG